MKLRYYSRIKRFNRGTDCLEIDREKNRERFERKLLKREILHAFLLILKLVNARLVGDFSKIVLNFANKFFLEIVNNHVKREILEEYVKLKIIKNAIIFGYL